MNNNDTSYYLSLSFSLQQMKKKNCDKGDEIKHQKCLNLEIRT